MVDDEVGDELVDVAITDSVVFILSMELFQGKDQAFEVDGVKW